MSWLRPSRVTSPHCARALCDSSMPAARQAADVRPEQS